MTDIIFDGPPGPDTPSFVEVEDPPGTSVRLGEWLRRDDGRWILRFSVWCPIDTAPHYEKIDLLAKCWLRDRDEFVFARFPDCRWSEADPVTNRKASWSGLDAHWRAVAWMPLPPIPKEWP